MRRCVVCKQWKVANSINFNRKKGGKYGLESRCNKCRKQYREVNKDKIAERNKQYYEANKEKIAECNKQYREANKEKIAERHKQWCEVNKGKIAEHQKRYYEANREKIIEQQKQYREDNKDKIAEYYEANKEKIAEYKKQYYQSPKGQVVRFNDNQRRRTKEEQQGSGITKEQWLEMMSFFDWECAYSGETLSKNTRSIDHIVPLNSGGDNMIWNCVPMTRSLNSSKNSKDMLEWYREQSFYSEARLQKIYKWQEFAYNKYGKDTQYFNTNDIQIKLI